MKKKLLLLFLVCLSAVAIFSITASAATYGDLSYEVSNGEVTITSCSATVISITIPSTIDGHPVTSIGRYAFDDCDILTSIIIPNSVTSIGRYAFNDCDSLEEITIPSSMTSIGEFAFSGCTGLTSITIPNSVTSIGSYAFHYCTFLTSITIPDSVTSIGSYALRECTSLTSITIPESVTSIGESAFLSCTSLEEITLPYVGKERDGTANTHFGYIFGASSYSDNYGSVSASLRKVTITSGTAIPENAFYGCSNLTSITIPDSVTSIGGSAFFNCRGLTSITIPDSVTSIGSFAFFNCSGLTSITIPESVTSIGSSAFYYCTSLEEITLPYVGKERDDTANTHFGYIFGASSYSGNYGSVSDSLRKVTITSGTAIPENAFYGCSNLTSITIPDSVTSIGGSAFFNCRGLTSITIPDSVTSIGSSAFSDCSGLTSITIPDGVTSIGGSAFYNCTSLKEVHISDIESWLKISFGNYLANPLFCAHNLYIDGKLVTSIIIPDSVTSIGGSAFSGCLGLTSITIPDSVTSIGGSAFSGCSGFTSITIPDSVTSIGKSTFEGCMNLEEITLPFVGASASAIKEKSVFGYIFGYTTSYSSTAISGATYQYYDDLNDDYYFYDYYYHYYISTTLRKVTITSGTAIPENAFYGCTGLTSITIPDSVTSIGGSAFSDCSGLTSITIPDSVTSIGESAFYGCTNLTSITIPDSVTSIGGSAFSGCSGFTSITIPDSVTSIGKSTFEGCINLEEITLPFIGASASATGYKSVFGYIFGYTTTYSSSAISGATYQCREEPFIYYHYYIPTNLKKVTITGVTTIPKNAFYNCSMLISITIPDSVTSIGSSAFYNCTSLTMYGYSGSYAETYAKNNNITFMPITELIEKGTCGASLTWSYTPSTKLLTISGSGAMTDYFNWEPSPWNEYAGSIKTVIIENGVTTIGSKAFADCSGMISITIPDSVTSIGSSAFSYCNSLTNITIPEGVTCIDSYTFADCSSLVGITIPESVTSIGERAFALCSGLTNITIPKGVTSIGDFAFDGCNRLEIVTVNPDSKLTSIGLFAFCGCSNLTSITIPVSVTSIGLFPFRDSDNLTIYGYSGSYAETYANNNNIPFIAIIPVSVEGASLVLDGSIGVKMYLNVLGAELASNTVVEFLVYDNSEDDTLSEGALTPIYDSDTGLYYVTTYVAPKDVKNVEIIYIIICDDLIIEPDSIMISDYISDFKELAKTDEEFAKALGVVEALETYVEYAESFFGNGEALEDVTADTAAIEKIAGPEKSGSLSGIKHISTSLVLEGQTTIRHYFEVTGGTYTFKVGEEELEATELGDGIIYVDVADIPAHDLDKIYTLSVNDTLEINYSALNYVKSAISSEDQKLSNLVKALCNYWSATEEYVA